MESENHFVKRSGYLRASLQGVNDGILSTTSLAFGVAAASAVRDPIILATLSGVVAGDFIEKMYLGYDAMKMSALIGHLSGVSIH